MPSTLTYRSFVACTHEELSARLTKLVVLLLKTTSPKKHSACLFVWSMEPLPYL